MKLKFWKKEAKPEPKLEPTTPRVKTLVDLPAALVEHGVLIRIDENGPRPVEEEGPVLERLGVAVSVVYDPTAHGNEHRRPWIVRAPMEYNYKGQCFGVDGATLVKSIGLEFPNAATPWAQEVVIEDGVLAWKRRARPDAEEVVQVVQEAQRQVARIMKRYGETKEILAVLKNQAA